MYQRIGVEFLYVVLSFLAALNELVSTKGEEGSEQSKGERLSARLIVLLARMNLTKEGREAHSRANSTQNFSIESASQRERKRNRFASSECSKVKLNLNLNLALVRLLKSECERERECENENGNRNGNQNQNRNQNGDENEFQLVSARVSLSTFVVGQIEEQKWSLFEC